MKSLQRGLENYRSSGKDTKTVLSEIKEMVLLTLNEAVVKFIPDEEKEKLRKKLFLLSLEKALPSSFIENLRDDPKIDSIEKAIDAILEKKEILDSFFGLETSDGSNTETEEKISSDVAQLVQLGIGTEIEKKSEIKIGARSSKSNKRTKLRSLSNDMYRERPESDELISSSFEDYVSNEYLDPLTVAKSEEESEESESEEEYYAYQEKQNGMTRSTCTAG